MIQKKRRKPRNYRAGMKYVAGRKYEQGYLDRLAESVGYRHRGDARLHVISNKNRARMARGMLKRWGKRAYNPIDNARHAVASVKWEGRR